MSPAEFWAVHAAIAAGGGLLVLLLGRHLTRVLQAAGNIDINSMTLVREFLQGRLKFLSALSGTIRFLPVSGQERTSVVGVQPAQSPSYHDMISDDSARESPEDAAP